MQITNTATNLTTPNFTSVYKINSSENSSQQMFEAEDEIFDYSLTTFSPEIKCVESFDSDGRNLNLSVNCKDDYDSDIEAILLNRGIKFKKTSLDEIRSLNSIISRTSLSESQKMQNRKLVFVDTEKFDNAFKEDGYFYIEKDADDFEFCYIKDYIDTCLPIEASEVELSEHNSKLKASFYDGRHRYCIMRNLGAKSVPVALDEDSIRLAKKYGIIDKIAE